ncbi:Alpha/Beta hydrolase protein [Mycena vulgaris]|nr:Alpha/Beta hydrolase protein [Mycena vulgaris]
MDAVAQMKETDIQAILFPTMLAFTPLLEPKREEITQARKTFKYGATDRHQLDVYYPTRTGKKHPLLIYVYGGGFVSGERTLPAPVDLGYGNLGLYFAQRGFVTIIPDYRLAPTTTFPGPADDLRDALAWAAAHPTELGPDADVDSVFFLGHSAGGVHTLTLLLHPPVLAPTPALRIKGAVIASAPYYSAPDAIEPPMLMYFGAPELVAKHEPLGLLRAATPEVIAGLPPLALIKCEHDPAWFKVSAKGFDEAIAERGVAPAPAQMMAKGHNHISFSWALGTGAGEEWAEEVVAWMESL